MRKFLIFLSFQFCISAFSQVRSNVKTCTINDADFYFGAAVVRRYDILFDLNKATLKDSVIPFLDSLANFLLKHNELVVEIGCHSIYLPPEMETQSHLTMNRSEAIGKYLVKKGVPRNQNLVIKGYGSTKLLYRQQEIELMKTKKEKDSLNLLNRRVEFRVIYFLPKNQKLFTLQDSVFEIGEVYLDYEINFDFDENRLRPESCRHLDSIATFLKKYPNLKFEIGCFTDSRASDEFNLTLTKNRAVYIANYLIETDSISPSRISYRGYGETLPINSEEEINLCQTKEEMEMLNQKNRRTEFKIISVAK